MWLFITLETAVTVPSTRSVSLIFRRLYWIPSEIPVITLQTSLVERVVMWPFITLETAVTVPSTRSVSSISRTLFWTISPTPVITLRTSLVRRAVMSPFITLETAVMVPSTRSVFSSRTSDHPSISRVSTLEVMVAATKSVPKVTPTSELALTSLTVKIPKTLSESKVHTKTLKLAASLPVAPTPRPTSGSCCELLIG